MVSCRGLGSGMRLLGGGDRAGEDSRAAGGRQRRQNETSGRRPGMHPGWKPGLQQHEVRLRAAFADSAARSVGAVTPVVASRVDRNLYCGCAVDSMYAQAQLAKVMR